MRKLISLGFRCDVAYQLRMHSGDNTPHFFDWLATPTRGLIDIFERKFDVFYPDHLVRRPMEGNREPITDRLTGVTFWHQFPSHHMISLAPHQAFYAPFISKFTYLADRFSRTVREHPVTLVRVKIYEHEARRLEKAFFDMFPGSDVQFLYVTHQPAGWITQAGHAVCMPVTPRGFGDPRAWARLLIEEGLIDRPFRLSTEEILGRASDNHNLGQEGRLDEDHLVAAVGENPGSVGFRIEFAKFLLERQRLPEALGQIDAAIALDPSQEVLEIDRLITSWRLKQITSKDAAADLMAKPIVTPYQAKEFLEILTEAEALDAALTISHRFMRDRPMDDEIAYARAEICAQSGRAADAELAVDHAIALQPKHWRFHALRAELLAQTSRLNQAHAASRKALQLHENPRTLRIETSINRRLLAKERQQSDI